ncbi:CUB domain-containing protein, partial [Caerostris darwini]
MAKEEEICLLGMARLHFKGCRSSVLGFRCKLQRGEEEELMAKQAELKTAVALTRSSLTNSELSMFINSLLVTCHNPRKFYGHNLVTRLKEQVKESKGFTHPFSYLALCNAQESWPQKAIADLNNILNSSSNYPFIE